MHTSVDERSANMHRHISRKTFELDLSEYALVIGLLAVVIGIFGPGAVRLVSNIGW